MQDLEVARPRGPLGDRQCGDIFRPQLALHCVEMRTDARRFRDIGGGPGDARSGCGDEERRTDQRGEGNSMHEGLSIGGNARPLQDTHAGAARTPLTS